MCFVGLYPPFSFPICIFINSNPVRSLGKKSVDFCGIFSPLSEASANLIHSGWIQEESGLVLAGLESLHQVVAAAIVVDVLLASQFCRTNAQKGSEDPLVQNIDVQLPGLVP